MMNSRLHDYEGIYLEILSLAIDTTAVTKGPLTGLRARTSGSHAQVAITSCGSSISRSRAGHQQSASGVDLRSGRRWPGNPEGKRTG